MRLKRGSKERENSSPCHATRIRTDSTRMDKNNQTIKNWVQLAVEGPVEHDTNGGTGGYKNSTWGEQMEGGDGANQDAASFDFLK